MPGSLKGDLRIVNLAKELPVPLCKNLKLLQAVQLHVKVIAIPGYRENGAGSNLILTNIIIENCPIHGTLFVTEPFRHGLGGSADPLGQQVPSPLAEDECIGAALTVKPKQNLCVNHFIEEIRFVYGINLQAPGRYIAPRVERLFV